MPSGFCRSDFTDLVMAVNIKASDKLPQRTEAGESALPVDPALSTRFQTEIDKMKRFTVVALHGVDTENDIASVADMSSGNMELAEQKAPLKINVVLQGNLVATKARAVVRGIGNKPDKAQIVYKVYLTAVCKDLRKGTVAFSEVAVGKARPRVQTLVNGRPRGGFDEREQSAVVLEAAQNALIELCNKLGNRFPAGGRIIAISRSGETLTLDKGVNNGVGVGQQCVIAVDDGGVTIPVALAEAYPETDAPKSVLKIWRWNESDNDARDIIKEMRSDPRGFLAKNRDCVFAVCYGISVPPEWEQNATK